MKYILSKGELMIEWITRVIIIVTIIYGSYMYIISPDQLPIHFNLKGEPDSYGNKKSLLIIMIINAALYIMLSWITTKKKYLNYPIRITPDNEEIQYANMVSMTIWMKLIIAILFLVIVWNIADNEAVTRLNLNWLLYFISAWIIGVTFYFTIRSVWLK